MSYNLTFWIGSFKYVNNVANKFIIFSSEPQKDETNSGLKRIKCSQWLLPKINQIQWYKLPLCSWICPPLIWGQDGIVLDFILVKKIMEAFALFCWMDLFSFVIIVFPLWVLQLILQTPSGRLLSHLKEKWSRCAHIRLLCLYRTMLSNFEANHQNEHFCQNLLLLKLCLMFDWTVEHQKI